MTNHIFSGFVSFSLRILLIAQIISSCVGNSYRDEARLQSDDLVVKIGEGKAYESFPLKYFPKEKSEKVLTDLLVNCDFGKRQGGFVNDFYQKKIGGNDRVSFIYEYFLKCDSIRLITTYDLGRNLELCGFKLEPIEKQNPMVLKK